MSEMKRSLAAAVVVGLCAGSFVVGSVVRDRADSGIPRVTFAQAGGLGNLMASRDEPAGITEASFFYEMSRMLKREYVEPISDEAKLATGAVRGMVASLGDPQSLYMDAPAFQNYLNTRLGQYEGIGAVLELVLQGPPQPEGEANPAVQSPGDSSDEAVVASPRLPELVVVAVTPGGPADRAGVRPGDVVESVSGHWVVNARELMRFRELQSAFNKKEITLEELNDARKDLRQKLDRSLLPLRARDRLVLGTEGEVEVGWLRNGGRRTTKIAKAPSRMPEFSNRNGVIVLPFVEGTPELLRQAIAGRKEVTIDLRNNVRGDFETMRQALAVLVPAGEYGYLQTERPGQPQQPLTLSSGNSNPPRMRLLVDETTRGAAEIFALALSSKGLASLSGSLTGGDRSVQQIVRLPDGSGYTLTIARYATTPTVTVKKETNQP
jgi:carboxyl-terminal processing protease